MVDNKRKFWDINIGQPGRVHDARVFALSSLFDRGQSSEGHISLVSQIISACCVLHNFCEVHNEMFNEGDYKEDEGEVNDRENREQAGDRRAQDIRNALCAYSSRM